ncbi:MULTISPECIES: glutamine--fructose-6-phosphate transaminase (isomerizing) [unclassified Sulfurospirillum]|uniref:glutamine--fructose-6-phosphate transaminase (isomerizing) n=1 Tax=unclassified Sulfurospirillum TaxID=2618290 RepID=UPI000542C981|nr:MULTISPECIES: glutamine--fructose-6-phosphate transaminase (isomerizing) [unclassified Sulfurospirillum]KHG33720.1 MAG: glucosamine--fructose-6-phosphate aminotransferase [Sulfurospirillum sp. MES]MCP3653070.1 glutamine--fructose-6-phosphate transaminase (isomerizing) [Sulfurospirillum sp. DNRA8]MCR1811921.1 glutamine--fructose-6-phosphate transaminase (isomerizing) [Sulfurospirillum sp. DNRA8]
MCGIVGYIGTAEKRSFLLGGLKELEYRGYDSAGIAVLKDGEIDAFKATGKLSNLARKVEHYSSEGFGVGIGHTRWATHGKPTEANAHPHWGEFSYIIHNGIIENYKEIKDELLKDGVNFLSQTDTEVAVHLFEKNVRLLNDCFQAFEATIQALHGAYAILLITQKQPDVIFFAKNAVPLLLGKNECGEVFFSSSDAPLIGLAKEVCYLEDGQYGWAKNKTVTLKSEGIEHRLEFKALTKDKLSAQKDGFRYFMEKEIYEQSHVVTETLMGRTKEDSVVLDELSSLDVDAIDAIKICACGTSYHAALSASYLFERLSKIRSNVEIASEFRYKDPLLEPRTLFIVISQSGETADTLEALKMAKKGGMKTLAICNVDNSSIVRTADMSILTRAGIEKGVASTKAFATQVVTLWLLSLFLAEKKKTITKERMKTEIDALLHIPLVLKVNESVHEKIRRLSKRYLHGHGFFFIGRDLFYPLALEGALKLKEISYLHAEGYPAGEMKHGPIALADSELFTIALMPKNLLYDKMKSNVEELGARDSTMLIISPEPFDLADDVIKTRTHTHVMSEYFEMMVITQLLALEISVRLGNDVDMPRNLAKSVTVE